ncbi:spindle pole body-associated sad1 [Pyrenophora seminiperda CCB06]|uniref:Spindle pole body-associated sad1 n=1 Tax=Pyrenophora seminiperda CCB06 TaxID=1302712 RepID=A0A3M7MDJ5_9PLEO|nr:spindle pole body-associated sad1 [Pyrenophora seminiperda CCB06]
MASRPNADEPTPYRRSSRISARASSVAAESASAVTSVTTSAVKRNKTTLTKVPARRSNAYGASGRVGNPDKLTDAPTTGFAQAFQNQRGQTIDDENNEDSEQEKDTSGETDELAGEPMSAFSKQSRHAGQFAPSSKSKAAPGYSFIDSDNLSASEDDFTPSVGNTTKSFGPSHEAGMLASRDPLAGYELPYESLLGKPVAPVQKPVARMSNGLRSRPSTTVPAQIPAPIKTSLQAKTPTQVKTPTQASMRSQAQLKPAPAQARARAGARATPAVPEPSVDELMIEEQHGPPSSQPRSQSQSSLQQPPRRRPHQKDAAELNAWVGDVEASESSESSYDGGDAPVCAPVWNRKRIMAWVFWGLMMTLLLRSSVSSMMATEDAESVPRTPGLFKAVGARVGYTYDKIAEYIAPPNGRSPIEIEIDRVRAYRANGEDHFLWDRMSKMDENNKKHVSQVRTELLELKDQLPDFMIMRREKDGSVKISDEFWHALLSKARSSEGDTEWARFLADSKSKLRDLLDPSLLHERAHTDTIAKAVTRDEFVRHMEKQYQNITERIDKKFEESIRTQSALIKTMVQTEARKSMMEQIHLHALAQANLVANYETHLTKPNYFSTGLGAVIDPDMTSATFHMRPGWFATLRRRYSWTRYRVNPPTAALTKWNEAGDCWCATQASGGEAQLAVQLGQPVIPKQITIEHIPMSMVPARNISNAPRDMELWVQTDGPINPYYSHSQVSCKDPPPKSISSAVGWKCLGSFKYNIYGSNHLQTFDLAGEPSEPIRNTILRVTSNWGAHHTCLYQVRLHGTDAERNYEYPVGLMD